MGLQSNSTGNTSDETAVHTLTDNAMELVTTQKQTQAGMRSEEA